MIFNIILGIAIFFITISILLMMLSFMQKTKHERHLMHVQKARDFLFKKYIDKEAAKLTVSRRFFFDALINVDEQVHLEPDIRALIISDFENSHFMRKKIRQINSPSAFRRKIAVYYVSKLRTEHAYEKLFERFKKEKNEAVKLRIVYHMRYGMKEQYLLKIIESFVGASNIYQERLATILGSNYKRIYDVFPQFEQDKRYEIRRALIRIGSFYADSFLIDYMKREIEHIMPLELLTKSEENLMAIILDNMLHVTPEYLQTKQYLYHHHKLVRKHAIQAYANMASTQVLDELMASFDISDLDNVRVEAISKMIFLNQPLLDDLLAKYPNYNLYQKEKIVAIFNERLDYIILKLYHKQPHLLKEILTIMLDQMMIESLIDFVNHNKNKALQTYLLRIMKNHAGMNIEMTRQFRIYLDSMILAELGLEKYVPKHAQRKKPPIEKTKIRWMLKWLTLALLLFPAVYIAMHATTVFASPFFDTFKNYVINVNIYLIAYFGLINMLYALLLVLSFIGSRRQIALSNTRKNTLLFSEKLLPGISIIAPAYNEELSIIESVTSLLNLKYPSYEVIVVNDGSRDHTLQKLIDHFDLERKHVLTRYQLNTKNVRGVYRTKVIPNLLVVDKENGGKADALNVGINHSNLDYVCGIDADSILEGDALLKLASVMLDDTKEHIALGGNIYPANGFTFDKGKAEHRGLPKENICRFQTIEYLRAFTSGRIGWSMMKSLMIISGAFGLFKKALLYETGGYLTSSSKLKKDTVGEDMELVVRLTRQALERKDRFAVKYVYNAYCYTELPSDMRTLLKQRNRWQRGLIDILSYHRHLGFNPQYKQIGFIGYPYFFIFEFLGPFFEVQGYIALVIGLVMGWLSSTIILAVFTISILFGVVISLSSLYMSEEEMKMMSRKETMKMLFYAIIENFGYRQMIGLHRVWSTFSAIRETGSWGHMKRKGFSN